MAENEAHKDPVPWLLLWVLQLPIISKLGLDGNPREMVRFLKFATVGAIGMLVDLTVYNLMYRVVLPPVLPGLPTMQLLLVANSISFTTAVISNFTWNRLWTFPESRQRPLLGQLGQFALVNIIGLAINNIVLSAIYHVIRGMIPSPFSENLAKIAAIGVVLFWNYGVNRVWTYRGIQ